MDQYNNGDRKLPRDEDGIPFYIGGVTSGSNANGGI